MGWIDLLALSLLVLLLTAIKPLADEAAGRKNYLSKDTGNSLRGLFAVVVVFHHLAQRTEAGWAFQFYEDVGHLPVAGFFFLSGYGLQRSYIASEDYRKLFLRRRLPKILLTYAVVNILCWGMYALDGRFYSLAYIFAEIMRGNTFVPFSWYIISICCFYVGFWLFMHICKENYSRMLLCACLWVVLNFIVCRLMQFGSWWYLSTLLLAVGMFWAIHEKKILQTITKYYRWVLLCTSLAFVVTFVLSRYVFADLISRGLIPICSVFFVILVLLFTFKMRFSSPVLAFLGSISLEVYLVHGLFVEALRGNRLYIKDDFLWSAMVFFLSVLFGFVLHKAMGLLTQKRKNRTDIDR